MNKEKSKWASVTGRAKEITARTLLAASAIAPVAGVAAIAAGCGGDAPAKPVNIAIIVKGEAVTIPLSKASRDEVQRALTSMMDAIVARATQFNEYDDVRFPKPKSHFDTSGDDFFDKMGQVNTFVRDDDYTTALDRLEDAYKRLPETSNEARRAYIQSGLVNVVDGLKAALEELAVREQEGTLYKKTPSAPSRG
jgi:hypothetical protein